jgi:hypothetical protein
MFRYHFPNGKIYKEEQLYPITDAMEDVFGQEEYLLDMETAQVKKKSKISKSAKKSQWNVVCKSRKMDALAV